MFTKEVWDVCLTRYLLTQGGMKERVKTFLKRQELLASKPSYFLNQMYSRYLYFNLEKNGFTRFIPTWQEMG